MKDMNRGRSGKGQPGTGKSHLATTIGVAAVKAGRSVYLSHPGR